MSSSSLYDCSSDFSFSRAAKRGPRRLQDTTFRFERQPFVYYAEVPDPYKSKYNGQVKNHKPNCFVKAFRWYTQEHGATKISANDKKFVEFAAWLDQKYEQYLRDSQLNATPKSEVSDNVEPQSATQYATTKADKPKGFQKVLKSPWRKRRASSKSPEGEYTRADHIDNCKCNPSWQIILRPKSMTRLPSETCTQKGATCYASSKITVASSDTHVVAGTYCKIRESIVVQEVPTAPENGVGDEKPTANADISNSQHTYVLEKTNCPKGETSKSKLECECPVEPEGSARTKTTDANTQYDPNTNNTEEKPIEKIIVLSRVITKSSVYFEKSSHPVRLDTAKNTYREGHNKIDATELNKLKPICTCTVDEKPQSSQKSVRGPGSQYSRLHGAAQTSDHALILDNCTCECPLLVRVVTARQ